MTRHVITAGIVVFWGAMMALLVKREVLPVWLDARRPAYRKAAPIEDLPKRTQMGIYYQGQRAGTHRGLTRRDTDGSLVIHGDTDLLVQMPLLFVRGRFRVLSDFRAGPDGRLRGFDIDARTDFGRHMVRGEVRGSELAVLSGPPPGTEMFTIPFDPQSTMAHDFSPYEGLGNLRVGQQWFIQKMSPFPGQPPQAVRVQVREKLPLQWYGERIEAYLLVTETSGMELRAWVRSNGDVLRQELPLGIVLEAEPYTDPIPASRPAPAERTRE